MKWRVEYLVRNVAFVDAPTKERAGAYCRQYLLAARVEKTEPVEAVPVVSTSRE